MVLPSASAKRGMEKGGRLILAKLKIGSLLISSGSHAHHHPFEIQTVYW